MSDKPLLLLVDDTPAHLDALRDALKDDYTVRVAPDGESALTIATGQPPDLVLLDANMPGMDGCETCRRLRAHPATAHVPIILVATAQEILEEARGFAAGASDYLLRPLMPGVVRARIASHLALAGQDETRLQLIRRLSRAVGYRDDETGSHVVRMSHFVKRLALAAGCPEAEAQTLFEASPMHDIGKIGIPDQILQKTGSLTEPEINVMRRHPVIGAAIIGRHDHALLETARIAALTHHERWDGRGYPRGLHGEQIPRAGRIVAVCDVFDSLLSARPYKRAWTLEEAARFMAEQSGRMFDPFLIGKFREVLPDLRDIAREHPDFMPRAEVMAAL